MGIAGRNFSVPANLKKMFAQMKHLWISLALVSVYLNTATGSCCGGCSATCVANCDCGLDSDDGDCKHPNSHFCCAPKAAGDCNLFCCECSACCTSADGGSNEVPALQKWRSLDKNKDMKLDNEEISYYLGNGTLAWTKMTPMHKRLTSLFLEAADSNSNGVVDPWEMDSSLHNIKDNVDL